MSCRSFLPVLCFTTAASAATITIESAFANWQNPTPNVAGVEITDNISPLIRIEWGAAAPKSAYEFDLSVPPFSLFINPPLVTPWFEIGIFDHQNFPIDPPFLASVELKITLDLDIDGTKLSRDFTYLIEHTETPNVANPADCQFPGMGTPGNCDDLVEIFPQTSPALIVVDGVPYTLAVEFFNPLPTTPVNQFFTKEGQSNTIQLGGSFPVIPEPSTYGMMAIGMLTLILGARGRFLR